MFWYIYIIYTKIYKSKFSDHHALHWSQTSGNITKSHIYTKILKYRMHDSWPRPILSKQLSSLCSTYSTLHLDTEKICWKWDLLKQNDKNFWEFFIEKFVRSKQSVICLHDWQRGYTITIWTFYVFNDYALNEMQFEYRYYHFVR